MAEQWHLLIVHNERQVREVLHQIFLGAGYKCLLANDGPAGLEAFGQSRPPLVITQLNLPHRLTPSGVFGGIELLKQVRREDPDVAVIVLSDSHTGGRRPSASSSARKPTSGCPSTWTSC
jgi:CheY-like chemotaxis protein